MTFDIECPPSSYSIESAVWNLRRRMVKARLIGPLWDEYFPLEQELLSHREWVKTRNFGT